MTTTSTATRIDVRQIAPPDRHPLIFSVFRRLGPSAAMEIVNDHDPRPLYAQMNAEQPGGFTWDYVERGPEVWHVRIVKTAASGDAGKADGSCCGGDCGGGRA
jgi:uncharacterized protein (DUF2249 family)